MSKGKLIVAIIILAVVIAGGFVFILISTNTSNNNPSGAPRVEQAPSATGSVKVTDVLVTKSVQDQSFIDVTVFVKNESKAQKSIAVELSLTSDNAAKTYSAAVSNIKPGETGSATLFNLKDFSPNDDVRTAAQIIAEY